MIYFDSKYLSDRLQINSSKWKRWAREFLPPDPLGGYQSGYARQFSFKDAFRVFLGGHLVAALRFTIPQARQILSDLEPWMKKQGLYALPTDHVEHHATPNHVYIYDSVDGKITYAIRTILDLPNDTEARCEHFQLTTIGSAPDVAACTRYPHARVVFIGTLHGLFLNAVNAKGVD